MRSRREFLKLAGQGGAVLLAQQAITKAFAAAEPGPNVAATTNTAAAGKSVAASKPNIIFILSDDHGQEFSGCYGNKAVQTPNLDALAKEGIRFTRVFAATPTCTPSRSTIFTGLYPARHGAMGNHTDCKPGLKSLPIYLKALGYRVALVNKSDVRPKKVFDFEYITAQLKTAPDQIRKYRGEGIDTARVDQLLADHVKTNAGQPLCLVLGDSSPHVVWENNKTYDPAALPIPPNMVDTPKTRAALANYFQDITTLDRRVGETLSSLKRHGMENNTLVIYSSDQGPEWPHCKWTLYDTGLRVPFIARWPGVIKPGSTCDALLSYVDLLPTLVEIAGGEPPRDIDGRSFKDALLGKSSRFREEIYATHTGDGTMNMFPQRCVRDARYKYILNLHPDRLWTTHFTKVDGIPNSHKEVWDTWVEKARTDAGAAKLVNLIERHSAEELYDTEADPYELKNLAANPECKPVLEKMREQLKRWRAEQGDVADE
ncbi:MAG: sulfatase [Candidatus Sumerlaeota bacterium]|nr:sulfatase [Candidatus Sumerlaeota bacterium]